MLNASSHCAVAEQFRERRQWLQTEHVVGIDDQHVIHVQLIDKFESAKIDFTQRMREISGRRDEVILDFCQELLRKILADHESVERHALVDPEAREGIIQVVGGVAKCHGNNGGAGRAHNGCGCSAGEPTSQSSRSVSMIRGLGVPVFGPARLPIPPGWRRIGDRRSGSWSASTTFRLRIETLNQRKRRQAGRTPNASRYSDTRSWRASVWNAASLLPLLAPGSWVASTTSKARIGAMNHAESPSPAL